MLPPNYQLTSASASVPIALIFPTAVPSVPSIEAPSFSPFVFSTIDDTDRQDNRDGRQNTKLDQSLINNSKHGHHQYHASDHEPARSSGMSELSTSTLLTDLSSQNPSKAGSKTSKASRGSVHTTLSREDLIFIVKSASRDLVEKSMKSSSDSNNLSSGIALGSNSELDTTLSKSMSYERDRDKDGSMGIRLTMSHSGDYRSVYPCLASSSSSADLLSSPHETCGFLFCQFSPSLLTMLLAN
jgi:hypothetical protein